MTAPEIRFQQFLDYAKSRSATPARDVMIVSIARQRLWHFEDGVLRRTRTVSTSLRPPSCIENSLGTPTGLHEVCERIGDGVAVGGVFKARVHDGRIYVDCPEHDEGRHLITTRILRLRGLEPGHNAGGDCDTYKRFVYIHGTNREDTLGHPASHGCVLLANTEMLDLFEAIPVGSQLWITLD